MFARVSKVQVQMEKFDEATHIYAESVVPAAKSQKGFSGAYLLTDRKTGNAISLTLWESEEMLLPMNRAVRQVQRCICGPPNSRRI